MTGAVGITAPLRIANVAAFVFRAPVARPVATSFGVMQDRPMVLVRVADADGGTGWGEVWCNFPGCGAEHRARLVETILRPLVIGRDFAGPEALFAEMARATRVLAIQSGEPGPLAQCIAGLDIAAWDLVARRAGTALWRLLGGRERQLRVYASGLSPDDAVALGRQKLAEGYCDFKLKVGFGPDRDLAALTQLRSALGAGCTLMADANQAWDVDTAIQMLPRLGPFGLD